MKIKRLRENFLKDRQEAHRKKQNGIPWGMAFRPNKGDPKTMSMFNNSVDSDATLGSGSSSGSGGEAIGESYEDVETEVVFDDPEVVKELRGYLADLGNEVNHNVDSRQDNLPDNMQLKSADLEVAYEEDTNDYYLSLYYETYGAFTGDEFRNYFVPEVVDSIKGAMYRNREHFDFYVEITCFDAGDNSYSSCALFVDSFGKIKGLNVSLIGEGFGGSWGNGYDGYRM